MTDWQPQVVEIVNVRKHPDADALEIATVLTDYPVIIKTGQYKAGDLAGYLQIDTIVPDVEAYHFLCPKAYEKYDDENGVMQQRQLGPKYPVGQVPEKYRILKAKRIRGTYSQGMLVDAPAGMNVGDSLVDALNLKKWEEPEEENLPGLKSRGANAAKPPEGWSMPHYDIDGIRKYVECLQPGEEIVLTEKVHGSNAGFSHDGEKLWVKSRNFYKKQDEDDMWWDVALRYDLATKLAQFPRMVFFGELYGANKGFRYDTVIDNGRLLTKIRFFDVWDTQRLRYLDYDDFTTMVKTVGLDLMPELYRGGWLGKDAMYPFAEGQSTLNPKHVREGWVLRTVKERYEPRLDSRMQVKLVGEGYNLQK
jgi:RNA ligase (TIGR02306 family)